MRMVMPINDLLDEDKCCRPWMETLPPDGLRCPEGHALPPLARLPTTDGA
jgi:hypothetical protein